MTNTTNLQRPDYGQALYFLPFIVFSALLMLRNSDAYSFLFEWLPVLGRTLPYFILTVLVVCVFNYRGGSLTQIGLCWPHNDKTKTKMLMWIALWAIAVIAMRIFAAVAIDPLLETLPAKVSRSTPLAGNLPLLIGILPLMWLVVIGEEVLMRGLLMSYLAKKFGSSTTAWLVAIVISAVVFGLLHSGKGVAAMISSGLGGLVYGLGYFLLRKNLWPVIAAHCTVNSIGFIGAYVGE